VTLEARAAALAPQEIVALLVQNAELQRQVDWFKRQLFGRKSAVEHELCNFLALRGVE
jgi:hypothetical protein